MIELKHNSLVVRFPDLHEDAVCQIEFQRTLRIPDDNRAHFLPPGLGRFPMEHVEDHAERLPPRWAVHGGVLLPLYQAEAMWINFSRRGGYGKPAYPFAVQIAAGKINALTSKDWRNRLGKRRQNYLVVPDQPWLDGFCVRKGLIRQFVAMPLGAGYSAEEQLTGAAEHGGLQIIVYPMKLERYEAILARHNRRAGFDHDFIACHMECMAPEMGLAPGGLMRQEIYTDQYGLEAWDQSRSSRCFVHILNSAQWQAATGKGAPGEPPTADDYTQAGLPWFDYYDDHLVALKGARELAGLDSVEAKWTKLGKEALAGNEAVKPKPVINLGPHHGQIKEGNW